MIMAGPAIAPGTCDTPVSLIDISATVPDHFGLPFSGDGASLHKIAAEDADLERPILREYHAAGAVSGAFMLRKGRWKLNYYVGFPSELYDMQNDPEELSDLAGDPGHSETLSAMEAALRAILDPETTDAQAIADQAVLIERMGGREAALKLGAPSAPPRLRPRYEAHYSRLRLARGGRLPRLWPAPEAREIEPGFTYHADDWQLSSARATHAQPILECLGFSVEADGKKFVYSGDTGLNPDITELCRDAEFLLHWCYRGSGEEQHPALLAFSPDAGQVADMAESIGVKRLFLSHFRIHMDSEDGLAKARSDLAKRFSGDAGIVEDLQVIEI